MCKDLFEEYEKVKRKKYKIINLDMQQTIVEHTTIITKKRK